MDYFRCGLCLFEYVHQYLTSGFMKKRALHICSYEKTYLNISIFYYIIKATRYKWHWATKNHVFGIMEPNYQFISKFNSNKKDFYWNAIVLKIWALKQNVFFIGFWLKCSFTQNLLWLFSKCLKKTTITILLHFYRFKILIINYLGICISQIYMLLWVKLDDFILYFQTR